MCLSIFKAETSGKMHIYKTKCRAGPGQFASGGLGGAAPASQKNPLHSKRQRELDHATSQVT